MNRGYFGVLLMVIAVIILVTTMNKCGDELIKEIEKYETKVGDMIIDYSFIENDFTLEDGRKININLLDKLECIEK